LVAVPLALLISMAQPASVAAAGTWTATGSMAAARAGHPATLLSTGKVLVAGGSSFIPLASAELYDPTPGTWATTGSMTTARERHTVTLLPSGKVLAAGGFNFGVLASAELYDHLTGTWTATGSMSTARIGHTATLLPSGKVLVAAGFDGSVNLASAELYDPALGTWTTTGSLTTARNGHIATLLPSGGNVLVVGGQGASGNLASAEIYDTALGTWTPTGSMSTARRFHTATLVPSGKVLAAGGQSSGTALASAELYDPVLGTWTATGSMTTARQGHSATLLLSGTVLAAGGANFDGLLATAELYQEFGAPSTLTLAPPTATNTVGAQHCVTATVEDAASNPVPGVTVRFSVPTNVATHASPSSGSATTDAAGQASFCFIATLPGVDDIHAFADTDNDGTEEAGEPFGDATKTWVLPTSTEFCEVMIKDIGRIIANNGDEAKFTGHAKVKADGTVQGQQKYEDLGPAQPFKVDSIEISATTCSSDHTTASIFGQATIDGADSHSFRVDVTDGKSAAPDTYGIMLDTGYASGQHQLTNGKVTIQ
jgi:hypothetical protein